MRSALFFLLLSFNILPAQMSVQWIRELPAVYTDNQVTGIIATSNGVICSTQGKGASDNLWYSYLTEVSNSGQIITTRSYTNNALNTIQLYNNKIYGFGTYLYSWDLQLNQLSKNNLVWDSTSNLWAQAAVISNDKISALYTSNYAFKYALTSGKELEKNLDNTNSLYNKKIVASGNWLYVWNTLYTQSNSGYDEIVKYDSLFNPQWSFKPSFYIRNFVTDVNGNAYILGFKLDGTNVVAKINSQGQQIWTKFLAIYPNSAALKNDSLYICGGYSPSGNGKQRKPAWSSLNINTGDTSRTNILPFFVGDCQEGDFSHVLLENNCIYFAGTKCSEVLTPFLMKLSGNTVAGIKKNEFSAALVDVYPNPTTDKLNLEIKSEEIIGDYNLKVTNTLGQVMFTSEAKCPDTTLIIPLSFPEFKKGIYFLSVELSGKSFLRKIIVE